MESSSETVSGVAAVAMEFLAIDEAARRSRRRCGFQRGSRQSLHTCCAAMTCGLCTSMASGISKKSARLAYCGLFGLSLVVSWILREVNAPLLKKFSGINTSDTYMKEWFQMQAVLRVSLGNFLFFVIFALIMIGVKDQNDKRDSWHHGGWIAKMVV